MKLKDDTVKVDNLHPLMKKRVAMFDIYHRRITGTDLVITSGNDGKHWGSISVEKRPPGWNEMKEDQIRELSDSFHYEDMAIDIRRWYFDALLPKARAEFVETMRDLFPAQFFDFINERTHFHIELDPEVDMEQYDKYSDYKYNITNSVAPEYDEIKGRFNRSQTSNLEQKDEIELPPLPKLRFWQQTGFKRRLGAGVMILGGLLSLFPATSAIGQGMAILGGSVGAIGVGHAVVKKKKNIQPEQQYDWLIRLVKLIVNLLTKKKG